jgi:hypothetical protein
MTLTIFMSSRGFDFETAIWDCRFSEWMKSLLSRSRYRVKGTFVEAVISTSRQRKSAPRDPQRCHCLSRQLPISEDGVHTTAEGQFILGKVTATAVEEFYKAKE